MNTNKLHKTCNVFCDASINLQTHIACAGAIFANEDGSEIITEYQILQNMATNNSAEILAVLTALRAALSIREIYGYDQFNIFSDSKISIFGLRDWIYGWVEKQTMSTGYFIGSNGEPVKNQDYFKECVRLIVDNNLHVNFFHQHGHVNTQNNEKVTNAYVSFIKYNRIAPEDAGMNIGYACYYNNLVDVRTKNTLEALKQGQDPHVPWEYKNPIIYCISKEDINRYRKLTKLRYA